MRRLILILGLTLATAALGAGVVLATGSGDSDTGHAKHARGPHGAGHAWASPAAVLGELTGLSIEDIQTELRAGASLAEIAEANGVASELLITALIAEITDVVTTRVETGTLTETQADMLKDKLAARAEAWVTRTHPGAAHEHGTGSTGRAGHHADAEHPKRHGGGPSDWRAHIDAGAIA